MAETEIHKRKRSKNLTLLAIILAWCLLIWLVTMVRMAQAQGVGYGSPAFRAHVTVGMEDELAEEPVAAAATDAGRAFDLEYFFSGRREKHQTAMDESLESMLERGRTHQDKIEANPEKWWPGWQERLFPKDYGPPPE